MRFLVFLASAGAASASGSFSLAVFAPDTKVDGKPLNAAGQSFYTGTSGPATYCPSSSVSSCPDVEGTLVTAGLHSMAVMVPRGQKVYIAPDGKIKYTMAHSEYKPDGAYTGGWFEKTVVQDCGPVVKVMDWFATDGSKSGGLVLCPKVAKFLAGTGADHALYAKTPQFNQTGCIDILGLFQKTSNASVGAWQYL